MTITTDSSTTVPNTADNGVNVEALLGAREAITGAPPAGHFVWKATSEWVTGSRTDTTVNGFFGLGEDQVREATHEVTTDHPAHFAATDEGMTPPEMVLAGLAGCLTAGIASVAQNRGIQLNSVSATIEGDLDMAGILGIDGDVRNGFSGVRVRYDIDADATPDEVRAVVAQSQKRSAVFDIVANPTAVTVEVA